MTASAARAVFAAVIAVHVIAVAAPHLAPHSAMAQHRAYPLAPPTRVHLSLDKGLFVCALLPTERFAEYRHDCAVQYPVRFFSRTSERIAFVSVEQPGTLFLMGTDELGHDVASQFLVGARQSLFAAEGAAALSLAIAVVIGTITAYRGGFVDRVFLRIGDIVMALPWLYALLALRGALPLAVSGATVTTMMILVLGLVGWVRPARVFRALVASTRQQGFVLAAVGFGAPSAAVITRHLLPVVAGAAMTQAAVLIPQFILAEVALSTLGVLGDSATGWGPLVASLQRYAVVSAAWWLTLPALLIVGVFVLFHKVSDAIHVFPRAAALRG